MIQVHLVEENNVNPDQLAISEPEKPADLDLPLLSKSVKNLKKKKAKQTVSYLG